MSAMSVLSFSGATMKKIPTTVSLTVDAKDVFFISFDLGTGAPPAIAVAKFGTCGHAAAP